MTTDNDTSQERQGTADLLSLAASFRSRAAWLAWSAVQMYALGALAALIAAPLAWLIPLRGPLGLLTILAAANGISFTVATLIIKWHIAHTARAAGGWDE